MCIAIVKKKNSKPIKEKYLRTSFKNNKDGAGIAYSKNNKLYIIKGIFNEDQLVEKVRLAEKEADGAILIHCRIGTSGNIDSNNTHPFIINNNIALIHNGILDIDVPKNSKKSDTALYVEHILSQLPINFIDNKYMCDLIEENIGIYNKFAFIDAKGRYKILNEKQGTWEDNIWYSNGTYKESRTLFCNNSYNGYYNWQNDELQQYDDIEYIFDDKTKKEILNTIKNLSDNDLEMLGEYPVYDITNQQLCNEYCAIGNFVYIEEISFALQDEYERIKELRGIA